MQGTHLYAPPEWLEVGEYRGEQATVWSLGVLAFVMLQVGHIKLLVCSNNYNNNNVDASG